MSKIERLYWEDEVAEETRSELVFGISEPSHNPNRKQMPPYPSRWCSHWRQRFELDDGLHVFASAWLDEPSTDSSNKGGFTGEPDIGFYLDRSWGRGKVLASPGSTLSFLRRTTIKSQVVVYPCEDWGAPEDPKKFLKCLKWLLKQSRKGMTIDIGCMGGHGRTGTALACLLVVQGLSPQKAITRVRTKYCIEAVESHKQVDFIRSLLK